MLNQLKKWALVATVVGGTLLAGGCLWGGKWTIPITMWLQEDLFS